MRGSSQWEDVPERKWGVERFVPQPPPDVVERHEEAEKRFGEAVRQTAAEHKTAMASYEQDLLAWKAVDRRNRRAFFMWFWPMLTILVAAYCAVFLLTGRSGWVFLTEVVTIGPAWRLVDRTAERIVADRDPGKATVAASRLRGVDADQRGSRPRPDPNRTSWPRLHEVGADVSLVPWMRLLRSEEERPPPVPDRARRTPIARGAACD
jgi:hypothetical protein